MSEDIRAVWQEINKNRDENHEIHLAVTRLSGRVDGQDIIIKQIHSRLDKMAENDEKILAQLQLLAQKEAKIKGGYAVLAVLLTSAVTIGGLIAKFFGSSPHG